MTAPSTSRRVVILGAGLGGLAAAWALSRDGYEVTLLEKSDAAGGLAVTRKRGGYEYDLGPHNVHSVHGHIIAFLQRNFAASMFEHWPRSKILKGRKYIDYPLRGYKVLASLPHWKLPLAAASFLLARVRMFLRDPQVDDSFEAWITNRFGGVLFGEYFGPYAAKVWGVPAHQVDRYVAEKRVPVIQLAELLRAALFGKTAGDNHPEFLQHNYYLRHGIGEIPEFFRKGAEAAGTRLEYGVRVQGLHTDKSRVTRVSYETRAGERRRLEADYVLSTIPLDEAVPLFDQAPSAVRSAAAELDYCASVLLFLEVARRNVLPEAMLYLSDPRVRFSRVYDVGMYSRDMVPEGKALLCLEFPCSVGDRTWAATDAELAGEAVELLGAAGVLQAGEVEGRFSERLTHSYPRFRVGFGGRVKTCFEFFAGFSNFVSYGRQGGFAYHNVDNVMDSAFRAAAAIKVAETLGYTCYEWYATGSRSQA